MYHYGNNINNGGGCAYVGAGGIWKISVPSSEFCCKLKTALKIKYIRQTNIDILWGRVQNIIEAGHGGSHL